MSRGSDAWTKARCSLLGGILARQIPRPFAGNNGQKSGVSAEVDDRDGEANYKERMKYGEHSLLHYSAIAVGRQII